MFLLSIEKIFSVDDINVITEMIVAFIQSVLFLIVIIPGRKGNKILLSEVDKIIGVPVFFIIGEIRIEPVAFWNLWTIFIICIVSSPKDVVGNDIISWNEEFVFERIVEE